VSFVHDGKALTSEGGAKSYDVAMYLVDHLFGEDVAKRVGRGLIISWPPAAEDMTAHIVE
jgi:transcriptional regulator GlxA family with amidase domain